VANYIKERTKNAQFIVISLRNNMFELAARLVGVYKVNHMTKSVTIENRDYILRGGRQGQQGQAQAQGQGQGQHGQAQGQLYQTPGPHRQGQQHLGQGLGQRGMGGLQQQVRDGSGSVSVLQLRPR
jgi:structural maintenance of chromosome 4